MLTPLHRRILGSVLAAAVGWVALTLILTLFFRYAFGSFGLLRAAPVESLATLAFVTGWAVFFIWIFLILPIYVFTPPGSFLWWWPVSTASGFAIGMAIVALFSASSLFSSGVLWAVLFAGGPGALAGLFASLTAERFHHVRADPSVAPFPPPRSATPE